MKKQEFDEIFDKAFEQAAKEHPFVPNSDASWERVEKQLEKRRKRKARLMLLPYIAASFILGALIFGTPTATEAFNPFIKAVTSITDDVVSIVFGTGSKKETKALTPPPPPGGGEERNNSLGVSFDQEDSQNLQFDSWEESVDFISFPAPNMPEELIGYSLDSIELVYNNNTSETLSLIIKYTSSKTQIRFFLKQLTTDIQLFSSSRKNDLKYKEVALINTNAFYFEDPQGRVSLDFIYNENIHFSILGEISYDEVILVANQILQLDKLKRT